MDELLKKLEALTQDWLNIAKENDSKSEISDKFYFDELFPLTCKVFEQKDYFNGKTFEGLIMTVGTSPEPLILSIKNIKPRRVLFLYTVESEKYLDMIISLTCLKTSQFDKALIVKPYVLNIYETLQTTVRNWQKYNIRDIAVDITGGTKSMTGGLAMAGAVLNFQLVYVDNDCFLRELRRPRPGSEFLTVLQNPYTVFGTSIEREASELIKRGDYNGAAKKYEQLAERHPVPLKYEIMYYIAKAYYEIDLLDLGNSVESLRQAIRLEKQRSAVTDNENTRDWQKKVDSLSNLKELICKDDPLALLKDKDAITELIKILYNNADKRATLERWDSASLYLYRLIEIFEQRRLALHGIDTAKPDYKDRSQEYLIKFNDIRTRLKKENYTELPQQISLLNGYIFLEILDDAFTLVQRKGLNYSRMDHHTLNRNNSILAHGFSFVGKEKYQNFKGFVFELLKFFCEVEEIDFPEEDKFPFL